MEKDALLEIVLHDLKEVETLMQSFKGKAELSPAFFKLTRRKMQSILEEVDMLEELTDMPSESSSASEAKERIAEIMESAKETHSPESKPQTGENSKTESKSQEPDEDKAPEPEKTAPIANPPREESTPAAPQEPAKEEEPKEEKAPQTSPEQSPEEKNPPDTKEHKPSRSPEREVDSSPKKENQVLGERLNTGKSSYNEQIARKATNGASRRMFNKPVSDLRKGLGINDRFFFQRELFGGSAGLLNETLDQLNEMNNMKDARDFLLTNFNWNEDNESVISFLNYVERRFL